MRAGWERTGESRGRRPVSCMVAQDRVVAGAWRAARILERAPGPAHSGAAPFVDISGHVPCDVVIIIIIEIFSQATKLVHRLGVLHVVHCEEIASIFGTIASHCEAQLSPAQPSSRPPIVPHRGNEVRARLS
jgi:hypothetical protein